MSEGNHNPRAGQYKGELPEDIFGAEIFVQVEPSLAWREKMAPQFEEAKAAGIQLNLPCPQEDRDIVLRLRVINVIPMRTIPREQWPAVKVDLGVLCVCDPGTGVVQQARVGYADMKKRALQVAEASNSPELVALLRQRAGGIIQEA